MDLSLPALGWIDWALLAVLLLSVLVGLWRGFVFELMALAGWLVAWFGAQWGAPQLALHLPVSTPDSPLRLAAAFILCFVAALLLWGLLSRLVRMLIHATPLSIPDRVLGGGFGVLRGVVLLLAVASVIMLTPAAQSAGWQASQGARWLELGLQALKPLLPPGSQRWFQA
jgi:membrane protein required for colicin V production